jgi:hypothetical protein
MDCSTIDKRHGRYRYTEFSRDNDYSVYAKPFRFLMLLKGVYCRYHMSTELFLLLRD